MRRILYSLVLTGLIIVLIGCGSQEDKVVVYTSVDRLYSEPVFEAFTEETGIEVLAVYDVEAAKTTGLVQRLISEKENPVADLFWNGEIMQSIRLEKAGVISRWVAFGGRARVLILNNSQVDAGQVDGSLITLPVQASGYRIGIAKPMFGTTATHVAAYYALFGEAEADRIFEAIRSSEMVVADGNGAVRDMVVSGQLDYGLTDTDDALGALRKGADVTLLFPDQTEGAPGTLVIPNTVCMIDSAGNTDNAETLMTYLQRQDTVEGLIASGWFQLSVEGGEQVFSDELLPYLPENGKLKVMDVSWEAVADAYDISTEKMQKLFLD